MPHPVLSPRATAACLVAAPLLLLAAHLLQPAHAPDTASEVAAQVSAAGRYTASTIVGVAAVLALVPAVAALARLLAPSRTAVVGGGLALAGVVGLCFLLGTGVGASTIAVHAGDDAVRLTERLEGDVAYGVGVGLFLLGWTLGLVVLAVGLGRRRVLPVWAAGCLGAAPFVPAVDDGRIGVAAGFVVLLVGFAAAARVVVGAGADRAPAPAPVG